MDQPLAKLPPLGAIRVFEAAARHLSFTRAAAELGMTQAAVSYQIKLLEDRVGTPLFRREPRRVALTETGSRLAAPATDALTRLAGAFAAARDDSTGLLSITALHTFASNWLVPRLGRFHLQHPGIAVQLDTQTRTVDFTRESFDIGIRGGSGVWPGLAAHRLMANHYTPIASPAAMARLGHPPRPLGLIGEHLFWESGDLWQRWFAVAGEAVPADVDKGGTRLETQQMLGRAVMAGQGVALLNPAFFADELAAGLLVQPFDVLVDHSGGYYLVYLEARRDNPKIAAFRDWILAEAG